MDRNDDSEGNNDDDDYGDDGDEYYVDPRFFLFDLRYHSYQAEEMVVLNGLDHKTLQKHLTNQTTHQWLIQRTPHQAMPTKPMEPRRKQLNVDNTGLNYLLFTLKHLQYCFREVKCIFNNIKRD